MEIQVLISQSASFTPAQEKKLVVGAKLVEHRLSQRIGGGGVSFARSKMQHTITHVETTKAGSIKSVVSDSALVMDRGGKIVLSSSQPSKFTPSQLIKLLEAPLPKTSDSKKSRAMRFGDATGDKATNNVVGKQIRALDKQIAELQSKRNILQAKLDKQDAKVKKVTKPSKAKSGFAASEYKDPKQRRAERMAYKKSK